MSIQKHITAASNAHSNLNIFSSLISVLEGGTIYGGSANPASNTARKIIKICKAETQRQLTIYDRAVDSATRLAKP